MTFGEKREQVLKNMPIIETRVSKSKDGKYLLHKTTITHIKPVGYYDAVLNGQAPSEENSGEEVQAYLVEEGAELSA